MDVLRNLPTLFALLVATTGLLSAGESPRFVLEWGKRGDLPGEFDFPIGIVIDPQGDVFVTDFYNARVQRFNAHGKFLSSFDVLPNPGGIGRDAAGNIYLTHFSAMKKGEKPKPDRVSVYTSAGKFVRTWGRTGTGDGAFDCPGGVAIGPKGRVYVADQTNRRVQVFDSQGTFLFKWGEYGVKPGQFGGNTTPKSRVGGPQFIAIDKAGNVYTTEGSVGRIQKFSRDGKFLAAWGTNDDKPGAFGGAWQGKGSMQGPVALCFDSNERLWVSAVSGRIQQFTRDGKYMRGFGSQGSKPGQFQAPHGIALDGRGHLYVVDAYNHRVQKFAIGK